MAGFQQRVETKGGNFVFVFTRIYTVGGVHYFVAVADQQLRHHYFNMQVRNGQWQIIDPHKTADWIVGLQTELSNIISRQGTP